MKTFNKFFLFFAILILFQQFAFAQKSKIDSLYSVLKTLNSNSSSSKNSTEGNDTIRVNTLNTLAWELKNKNIETAIILGTQALNLSFTIFKSEGDESFLGKVRERCISKSYQQLGVFSRLKGNYPSALNYCFKSLKIRELLKDKRGISSAYTNIGTIYNDQADYPKALDYFLKSLKIAEELNNENLIALDLGSIGNIYIDQKNYSKALGYFFKALNISDKSKDKTSLARNFGNIGNVYSIQAEEAINGKDIPKSDLLYENALNYYSKTLKIYEELNDKNGIVASLSNIGNIYQNQSTTTSSTNNTSHQKQFSNKALDYYLKALQINEESKNKNLSALCLGNIGGIYLSLKKYKEAEEYLQKALVMSISIGTLDYTSQFEKFLSELYTQTNQPAKALVYYKKYTTTKDSIFNDENTKKTVRSEMNFEFEKKQAEQKTEQEKENAIANAEKQKQKIVLLLVIVLAGFMFNRWRVTKKQKQLIEDQKKLVDIAYHQIEEKNKEITDSINYASRIQQAMLTSEEYIEKALLPLQTGNEKEKFFILYQPKDIVSGDFYWAYTPPSSPEKIENFFYIATADCTGHGVPGAFMSLLNINFLNENIIERNITEPNKILNEQRKEIIKALNPKGTENSKDGMDCVLCKFDYSLFEDGNGYVTLTYSAANNPLWIIKNNSKFSTVNSELVECKADKMPVGKYDEINKEFSQQTIQLQKGDTVYTFTDGYADQLGGPQGKKFKYKQLSDLLLSINHLSMIEQRTILEQTINNWKGNLEQIDDILIIGIKI